MKNPAIGVLLPIRNAAGTLDASLRSLWRQTFTDFEVLAVNDGSTDQSSEILKMHAAGEKRLQILDPKDDGLIAALELARANTNAPYLARMDADDLSHRHRFVRQIDYLNRHPEIAAVGSRVALFPRSQLGPGWRRYQTWLNSVITPRDHSREIFVESPLAHPSVLMRKTAVDAVGGYRDPDWAEDYDLWLRLSEAGWGLAKVNATLLGWRHSAERLSMTDPRYSQDAFQKARAHYLARLPLVARNPVLMWGAGRTGRKLSRLLFEHGVSVVAFFDVDRRKIGGTLRGAPIRSWKELPPAGDAPLLVAVGSPGARELIRPETIHRGYEEGKDLWFAA